MPKYTTLKYATKGRVATITLNRPERLNAINDAMPGEIRVAVERAQADNAVHVIVLQGAGPAFCAGYDLKLYAEGDRTNAYTQPMPWDPLRDYAAMKRNTEDYMSLWRCHKPTIAKVHGYAAAGGSDIALCCDLIVMAHDARIGYMPARVWGCPTTAMWVYRIGPMRAKRMLFTGDLIDGRTAAEWGLALQSVDAEDLDAAVATLAERIAGVPRNQLTMMKLMVNQAVDAMGLEQTQMFATLFDGITRHTPEGLWFKRYAEQHGFPAAAEWRDSGRPLPALQPGDDGREHMAPPPKAKGGARSAWSRDVAGRRSKASKGVSAVGFEPEFVAGLKAMWEERIVFNRVLGLHMGALEADRATAWLAMRPELVGHFTHQRIHGGVISASLDAMGGLAVMAAIGARHLDEAPIARLHRFSKLGTIDLRIDYLRPGIGERFDLSAEVLRLGSRVATTRMDFRGADGKLLATGAAAYIVS